MVKRITRRRFLKGAALALVTSSGIVCTLGSNGGSNGDKPEPEPDIEPSIDSLTLNNKTGDIMLGHSEPGDYNVSVSGSRIPLEIYVRVKDRADNALGIEYTGTGNSLSGTLELGNLTGLMRLAAVVQDNEGIGDTDSLDFSRISDDKFNWEGNGNPYNDNLEKLSQISDDDWKRLKDLDEKYPEWIISLASRDEIDSLEAIFGNNAVGIPSERYFVLNEDTALGLTGYELMLKLVDDDTTKSIGYTDKWATANLKEATYKDVKDAMTPLTGVNSITEVVRYVTGAMVTDDPSFAGAGEIKLVGPDLTLISVDCDEKIYYEGTDIRFLLGVVHNPSAEELNNMQALNEIYNRDIGGGEHYGIVDVYNKDNTLVVFKRIDQAISTLLDYQGVPIPLEDPEPIQNISLNMLTAASAIVVAVGYNKINEINKRSD